MTEVTRDEVTRFLIVNAYDGLMDHVALEAR
jgi:hypothetical protein